jgi:glycogen synthase
MTPDHQMSGSARPLRLMLYNSNRGVGGAEEHVVLLARYLDRSRVSVFAVCPASDAVRSFRDALEPHVDGLAAITFDYQHASNFFTLIRQIREWRIDVVHMHSGWWRGNVLSYLATRLAGVSAVVITEHLAPEEPEPLFYRIVRNGMARIVSATVSVSQKNFQQRSQFLSIPPSRAHVVENGVAVDDFQPAPLEEQARLRAELGIPASALVVGSVVRFEPGKGLEYFVDAMPEILRQCPDARFLLVGDGSLRAELEAQAERVGVRDRVHFAGFQTRPRPYLSLLDVFVLPVPVGSMSIALLEAMAMRKAVVMTFGGEGEAVVHGETGFSAEPRNPGSIAEYVTRLLSDDALRLGMGERARRHVEDHFSAATTARKLERIYDRVAGRVP